MASGSGSVLDLAQSVVLRGVGSLVSIAQDVELRNSGSGSIVSMSQSTEAQGLGSLVSIAQRVRQFEARYDFSQGSVATPFGSEKLDVSVYVGGVSIPNNQIIGEINITRAEDQSALCDFTLYPPSGTQDLNQYHGKSVVIIAASNTRTDTLYRGVVDVPTVDLIGKRITLNCTDSRKERNNALSDTFVDGIGYYSDSVFSVAAEQSEKIEQRLQTIPYSFDYDADGIGRLVAWKPKTVADYVLSDSGIFYRQPGVQVLSRGRVTNKVVIDLEFQYQRLRHREINYTFDAQLSACLYAAWGLPPTKTQVKQAIGSAGWPYTDFVVSKNIDPSGLYTCINGVQLAWSTRQGSAKVRAKTDSDGKVVTDANGEIVYETYDRTSGDISGQYAQECNWKASKRWAQNIVEKLQLTVSAPQSIAQYGEVKTDKSYGVTVEYDTTGWEDYDAYETPPSNTITSANGDKYIDADSTGINQWNNTALTALHIARTEIHKAHRDNIVSFEVPLWPSVALYHTIETNGSTVKAKGKVSRIVHRLDVTNRDCSTSIELALSQSTGSTTDSGTPIPTRPIVSDSSTNASADIKLFSVTIPMGGTQDPESTGYIFQQLSQPSTQLGQAPAGRKVPVALIIDTPPIDDASRNTKESNASQVYNVEIRNDLLEVIF